MLNIKLFSDIHNFFKALMKAIDDGEVGEVKQVLCGFGNDLKIL